MRAVAASGNRTVPFDVSTDSTRVADSYFSIVPRSLSVVDDDGGADWTKPSEASAAARIRSGSRFLAMSLAARSNGLADITRARAAPHRRAHPPHRGGLVRAGSLCRCP